MKGILGKEMFHRINPSIILSPNNTLLLLRRMKKASINMKRQSKMGKKRTTRMSQSS
jgi:hypothetical protein